MDYLQVSFIITPFQDYISDVLAAELGEIGFESFVAAESGIDAYVQQNLFSTDKLANLLHNFPLDAKISYHVTEIESKDWNEEWEKNFFEPIVISNKCVIHSSFHANYPTAEYDITIDPKMAFGTGHHETTSLMLAYILDADLSGKTVLDMGCGTAVLAILAAMRGAKNLTAIDIDTWCVENSLENIALNNVSGIDVKLGDAALLDGLHFDVIFANINRNILLADMEKYAACLSVGGQLYMSGFYCQDIKVLEEEAKRHGLQLLEYQQKNNWAAVKTEIMVNG
ncbi:MAG: 50S ribosomal protein L11 methyltransferase [Paludibacter sp.]|jgi:ribosomal protein L11 methyltransferase|nr:50S ribosomal protein L11 methyltransferase [Paludibacter sp.]